MATSVTTEHECKLEAPAGWELPDLGGLPLETRDFASVYHDTPDRSLARSGITLRHRIERGLSVWQLKLPGDGARIEVEERGGPAGPPPKLRELLRTHERHAPVAPVAELRTRRGGVLVRVAAGTAEVTVDEVRVMDAQRMTSHFSEIEVELREGKPSALGTIAKRLRKSGAENAAQTPKLLRVLPLPSRVGSDAPFDVLCARLRAQLDQILAQDPGVRLGAGDEHVHQMRVATRRARALLRAGRTLYIGDVDHLDAELRWLAGVLGAVRDLDVLVARLRDSAASLEAADAVAARQLIRKLERSRTGFRRTLLRALDGPRYAALLDSFESTVGSLCPSEDTATLPSLAKRELKRLRKDVDALPADPEDELLHSLRKRGKRVRYAHELADDADVVKAAKGFQDVLGDHQDSVVAEDRLRVLAAGAPADQAVAAGQLIALERERRAAARAAWRGAWKKLRPR